jgi:hypothetical protein
MDILIQITNDQAEVDAVNDLLAEEVDYMTASLKLVDYMKSIASGMLSSKVVAGVNPAKASGTFEGNTVIATDAIAINGTTFTAVSSGATGNQFNIGGDDAETMANLAAAINASTDVNELVEATAEDEVVTITAKYPGILGNAITISSADATITASGARLSGGDQGAEVRTHYYGSAS